MTDKEALDRAKKLRDRQVIGLGNLNVTIPSIDLGTDVGADWERHDLLQQVLAQNSAFMQSAMLKFDGTVNLTFTRDQNNPLYDSVSINHNNPRGCSQETYLKFISAARDEFGELQVAKWEINALGADIKAHYQAREGYLNEQEKRVSAFFLDMEAFTAKQMKEHQERMQALEERYVRNQQQLEAAHKERMDALDSREAELKKREAAFDSRESRQVRRELREKLKAALEKRSQEFRLTAGTRGLRRPVAITSLVCGISLGCIALVLLFSEFPQMAEGKISTWLVVRQALLMVGAIAFLTFYIRWANLWFQRHADEEFKLKRLDLDIDRASWLVEMALEWRKENNTDIPADLLKELGKLFASESDSSADMNPAETLASAIFGAAASVKVKTPDGTEVNLDRKGIKQLDNPVKPG